MTMQVDELKYLGWTGIQNDDLEDVTQSAVRQKKLEKVCGVLWHRKINVKIMGKVKTTGVRPAIMYGAEIWPVKEEKIGCSCNDNTQVDV